MATYPYKPLDLGKLAIRLLHIQQWRGTDDIICQLVESYPDPEKGVPYTALSYNWGRLQHSSRADVPRVVVDGNVIGVTENLYSALWHIRRTDKDVILWVDAICINQQDPQEKGHQVKQMRNVYKNADEVLIWLGPSNDDIDFLLESIRCIDQQANEDQANGSKEDWKSLCGRIMSFVLGAHNHLRAKQTLAELVARPWFKRVWVLQEVANARKAQILCGSCSCPARTFALMPSLLGLNVSGHTQAVLDIMPRHRRNTWWSSTRSLHSLLVKFADSEAHLTRDKIYALLGMSEDAWDPDKFYPCYRKPDGDVFRDTASFLLFGEVLDKTHAFPYFKSPALVPNFLQGSLQILCLPIARLAAITLAWILEERKAKKEDMFGRYLGGWGGTEDIFGGHLMVGWEEENAADRQRRDALGDTADLLVARMNDGKLSAADVLLSLAERHDQDQVKRVRDILSEGDLELHVTLDYGRYNGGTQLVFAWKGDSPGAERPVVVVVPHGLFFPQGGSSRARGEEAALRAGGLGR